MASQMSEAVGDKQNPLLDVTIGAWLEEVAAKHPDSLAIVMRHQDIRWTYKEYLAQIDRLAGGLLALGIEPGDRVGIWAPNCIEWCLAQFATARMGAILVCINPAYRVHELEYALNKVECKALITAQQFKSSNYISMLQGLAPELSGADAARLSLVKLPSLRMIIRMGEEKTPGMLNFDDVMRKGDDAALARRVKDIGLTLGVHDAINIQFTSGTTGNPKGATLTHYNILNNAKSVGEIMRLGPDDRLCIPVPLYHCFGMVLGTLTCVAMGAASIFPGFSFNAKETLETVVAEKCTGLHGVPTMFIAELDDPDFETYDLTSLRTGIMAGAPCPENIMRKVMDRMHMSEVLIGYGQTELSPINCMTSPDDDIDHRVGSVGRVMPHLEIRIVDEANKVTPRSVQGEICTRGYSVMKGYWADEERTAETIDQDGWLHSGDLAEMDEGGYVKITGRIKDMIIRGGENVYPREIEEFLYTHSAIQEAQVFGVPDEKFGEQVAVWIKLRDGCDLDEEGVKSFCRDNIAHYKVPHYIRFVDEFPMTVTGKIQKFKMRDEMVRFIDQDARRHG